MKKIQLVSQRDVQLEKCLNELIEWVNGHERQSIETLKFRATALVIQQEVNAKLHLLDERLAAVECSLIKLLPAHDGT